MGDNTATFADLLRRFRDRAELTQEELAERAGISADAVGLLERGERRRPHADTVMRLVGALKLTEAERTQFAAIARRPTSPNERAAQPRLPAPSTALVGRAEVVDTIVGLFEQPEVRLVTLTGPGGVGKTRVALATAERMAQLVRGGVVFVPLAALRDPDLVAGAVAAMMGIREHIGQPLEQRLIQVLQARRVMLVLDNFEHLLPAARLVGDLLVGCPQLALLVTSRAPLHLAGEQQFAIPALDLPPTWQDVPVERLSALPAVALFQQRAQAVAPSFMLTAANAETVLAICRRLDGLPLAIELAAAWSKLLPPLALLERLERRLPLLVGGPRDLPERQRTMHATIAWSYDLLGEPAQALLRRLAVYVGGWTLAEIEVVSAADGPPQGATLAALAELVDASLVHVLGDAPLLWDEMATPRYTLLEIVREFALDRLAASGEQAIMQRRHASHYLELAETLAPQLIAAEGAAALAQLEAEHANLRAALQWALDQSELLIAVHLAVALWRFWVVRSHLGEGRAWLETVLGRVEAISDELSPISPAMHATLLHVTGNLTRVQADYARATHYYQAALTIRRAIGDEHGVAGCLHNLGIIAEAQCAYDQAEQLHRAALQMMRGMEDQYGLAFMLASLANAVLAQGRLADAGPLYAESLELYRSMGYAWGIAYTLAGLGDLAHAEGQTGQAFAYYEESLALHQQIGNQLGVATCLAGLARLSSAEGRPEHVAQLMGAADLLREQVGAPRAPSEARTDDRVSTVARVALGEAAFARHWEEGRRMPLAQVIRAVRRARVGNETENK